jgi:hypothetical protein
VRSNPAVARDTPDVERDSGTVELSKAGQSLKILGKNPRVSSLASPERLKGKRGLLALYRRGQCARVRL